MLYFGNIALPDIFPMNNGYKVSGEVCCWTITKYYMSKLKKYDNKSSIFQKLTYK